MKIKHELINEMVFFGKKAVNNGLVEANMGNISSNLMNSSMLITITECALDELDENSFIIVDFTKPFPSKASRESIVHAETYEFTDALAIFHIHSLFSVVMSLRQKNANVLKPLDVEGEYYLNEIPIVNGKSGSYELAKKVSETLTSYKSVVVKGHGTFSKGDSIEEAYNNAVMTEHSSKILYYTELNSIK